MGNVFVTFVKRIQEHPEAQFTLYILAAFLIVVMAANGVRIDPGFMLLGWIAWMTSRPDQINPFEITDEQIEELYKNN